MCPDRDPQCQLDVQDGENSMTTHIIETVLGYQMQIYLASAIVLFFWVSNAFMFLLHTQQRMSMVFFIL